MVAFHLDSGTIPLQNFRMHPETGRFFCEGGRKRMALSQDGSLWGCYLFPEFFKQGTTQNKGKNYSFGKISDSANDYEKNYPKIISNYTMLRGDRFFSDKTICALCPDVEVCCICPVSAAFSSGLMGKIPEWMCSLHRLLRQERELFLKKIETLENNDT